MSNYRFKRGEVYLIEEHDTKGHEQKKTRPWVIVSASVINRGSNTIVGIPLSFSAKIIPPLTIKILHNNAPTTALINQLRALDKRRIIRFEGEIHTQDVESINNAMRVVLALT